MLDIESNMAINIEIEIKPLVECQEHITALATLWYEEISRHWVNDASIDKAKIRLLSHLNNDKMPMAVVAIYNGHPIGMACLRETDGIRPEVTPWLGSLVVNPDFRGNKIGETLIESIKKLAKKMGYNTLYLLAFDLTIPSWYAKLGWIDIGVDELFGHQISVMSIKI